MQKKYSAMLLAFAMSVSLISGCTSQKQDDPEKIAPEIQNEVIAPTDSNDPLQDIDKDIPEVNVPEENEQLSDGRDISEFARSAVLMVDGDEFGSLNGTAILADKNDWDASFGADGWEFQSGTDEEYFFAAAENPKYEKAQIYAYGQETLDSTLAKSTAESIKNNGFYGYSVRMADCENKPAMTWCGLTFGASAEEILETYGEPEYVYDGTLYSTYQFRIHDNATVSFNVYTDGGMQDVDCRLFA